jgi:hypothetical protein
MRDAMRRVPCTLDPIGQGSPRLRHTKQRSLALGVLKRGSCLEAINGAQPVERYEFAGRHPHPQYVFSQKPKNASLFPRLQRKTHITMRPSREGAERGIFLGPLVAEGKSWHPNWHPIIRNSVPTLGTGRDGQIEKPNQIKPCWDQEVCVGM